MLSAIPTVRTRKEFAYSETSNKLYIANSFDRTIDIIDCQNHQVIETIQLTDTITAAVWNAFSNEIYFTQHAPQQSDCHVELIDCTNDSIVTSIPTGGYPKNLHCNPMFNKVYCANAEDLLVIDGSTHKPVQCIPLDPSNNHLFTYNTVNHKLYCINVYADNISVIDGIGDTLIITLPLGSWASCAAYNPIGNRVYVGHVFSEDVYVIDGNTNQITGYLNFGAMVTALAYDSTDNRLFIVTAPTSSDDFYADMIVLDGTSHAILDTLETGIDPWNSILWEGEHNQVWVGNHGLGNLPGYTIDGYAADSLVHLFTTPVGFTPFAAILNPATSKYYGVGRSSSWR